MTVPVHHNQLVIASVSGGKDSTAMCLHLKEAGIPFRAVFMDTGWEHEDTYEYLRTELPRVIGQPVEWIRGKLLMVDLVRKKAMFPSRLKRYCTEELKVFPMRDYIRVLQDEGFEVVNAVGIRAEESAARAEMTEWEENETFDCVVWRPLIRWTTQDVIDIHTRHGVKPNPLYLRGSTRVGCWPCIFARKAEIRAVGETDPDRIDLIEMLERELTEKAGDQRTFFQSKDNKLRGKDSLVPIRKMVEWSQTAYGGKEFEEYDADAKAREGCMRWGLCATEPEPEAK